MKYLTAQDILVLHARIIDATGGLHGTREIGLLMSLTGRPKTKLGDKEPYRGIFGKSAVYLESLARGHVFVDGNKRTAIAAAARFLFLNGYQLAATNKAVEEFVLDVVTKKLDLETITKWLKTHSKRIRK